ncbi:XRE family transcriptional regulator [Nocardioides marmoriginsengisoli]|uniref:XRE family transcriptional regulator n=1 Tax=Nocardioides marmoriginsengisoli TaxID=661483 RepID=A0A3N0CPI1_9ACTN|nr:helix-turn-helix transcriptional regulator [Nocardioides marmoriginsengisoli]RNL65365.1 XRE family transcriptional regulator [Nocardioides marmoriginsengisoli]
MTALRTPPDTPATCGDLLRTWRQRRHLSQLELSSQVDVSTRHLSFVETGRSKPSREMVLHLADHLDVPLRDRNQLLLSAGFAPVFPESSLHSPQMLAVRETLRRLLAGHNPYPALVVDRWWNLVEANDSLLLLIGGVAPELLTPPVNVLRLSLHPDGITPNILNHGEWRSHLLSRLRRQVALTADHELADLLTELEGYPCDQAEEEVHGPGEVVVPLRLRIGDTDLALLSTVATFGTPLDVTVAELVIESFFPADEATADWLRASAASS